MSITILKSLLLRFLKIKIKQKVSTFPKSIVSASRTGKLTLHYYRLLNIHVRTGMHLVLVNILICYRGEAILVLDIH